MTGQDPEETKVEAVARQQTYPTLPDKLERIFLDHHAQVYRAAYRVTGSASDAEDVVQTVFLRLVRMERGEGLSESPGSYLHRAAVNAALDVVRGRRASKASPIDDVGDRLPDAGAGPERREIDREVRDEVRRTLSTFSPKMAEIFVLRYFEGYDNHEIATMLHTSRSTVAVLLHRARHRLKKQVSSLAGGLR
jgi:RNA polymerase sigma-70 factor (ECF subfamily)